MNLRIAIACDHGGFELKVALVRFLNNNGYEVVDLGTDSSDPVDYPDEAKEVVEEILSGKSEFGILVCGTGIGVSLAANKYKNIRAALCMNSYMARMAREHNNANVLCLGGRVIGSALAEDIVTTFLSSEFQGGRHSRRINKLELT